MNAEERKALREKHRERIADTPDYDCSYCHPCETDYPCDVIKVLDATENLKFNDLKTEPEIRASATSDVLPINECDHLWLSRANAKYQWTVFTFCPKCGEKL